MLAFYSLFVFPARAFPSLFLPASPFFSTTFTSTMARGRAASTAAARLARLAVGEATSGVMATSSSATSSSLSASSASAAASRALARLFSSRAAGLASAYGAFERDLYHLASIERVRKKEGPRSTTRTNAGQFLQQPRSCSLSPIEKRRRRHDNGDKKNEISISGAKMPTSAFPFQARSVSLAALKPSDE